MQTGPPTRRQALLAVLALPLADVRVLAGHTGHLTVPLDSWGTVRFTYDGHTVEMTTGEIFAALKGR